ncbi:hypothetical protein OsJ_23386 [Oryza sativa Japonica Group]|uniref:rRNA N-glycosylase n=1 Tax=Oryza sativa subsp. japonica TaxID=39947 RepID=B9FVX7_ORYSJ|nr:hypothetical protein OsJ_23386 [Oryza sativa Japonica Group]
MLKKEQRGKFSSLGTQWVEKEDDQEIVKLELDVSRSVSGYRSFMYELQRQLAKLTVINKGHGESTLAIRPDNVYLIGFRTQAASWFAFKNSYNQISRATALGFDDSYTSLTGKGGYTNLKDIVVGKKSAQEAVATLAKYKKDGSVPEEEIKKALTTFILIICEAVRLVPVRTDVITVWDEAEGGKVGKVACDLTVKWKVISCA